MEEVFEKFSDGFTDYIKNYESDTFSAEGSKMTQDEANLVSVFFLLRFLNGGKTPDEKGIDIVAGIGNTIDGVEITEVLEWIREDIKEREQQEIKKEIEK